ncbi:hypothetical protein OUZ56_014171 [Daphnia magna]|uniref:Uncharacterized protein n=1 Tax=Daphnia magna TaxID=35525 RepID=A0ABQ9Z805_9CRUS|nr:hypothetical protein OUZ56_014171 [Daphnia magna]
MSERRRRTLRKILMALAETIDEQCQLESKLINILDRNNIKDVNEIVQHIPSMAFGFVVLESCHAMSSAAIADVCADESIQSLWRMRQRMLERQMPIFGQLCGFAFCIEFPVQQLKDTRNANITKQVRISYESQPHEQNQTEHDSNNSVQSSEFDLLSI